MANPVADMMAHKGAAEDGESDGGDSGDYTEQDAYDTHVRQLKSALGLDDAKASLLAEAICGLAKAELPDSEEKPSSPPPGKGGVALVIGMGRKKG